MMKPVTAFAIVMSTMWVSVSAAVITALIITGRLSVLWFLFVPVFGGYSVKSGNVAKGEQKP